LIWIKSGAKKGASRWWPLRCPGPHGSRWRCAGIQRALNFFAPFKIRLIVLASISGKPEAFHAALISRSVLPFACILRPCWIAAHSSAFGTI
jgi:hypothetical protein